MTDAQDEKWHKRRWTEAELQDAIGMRVNLIPDDVIGQYLNRTPASVRLKLERHKQAVTVDARLRKRCFDHEHLVIRKHQRQALAAMARRRAGGSVRDLVATIIQRCAERPELVETLIGGEQ